MRLSRSLCAAVAEIFTGSHASLEARFRSAGITSIPPDLPHHTKWKEWLFLAGQDPSVDSLSILGKLIEEFMDVQPSNDDLSADQYSVKKSKIISALESSGLRYYREGRILPQGSHDTFDSTIHETAKPPIKPSKVEELLEVLIAGLRRAMHPLTHRRKGCQNLVFENEYDVQDLLHSLLRPWIKDIRPEEFTPSYASSSTRMDFLLHDHQLVLETKIVRDKAHAKKIGDELIVDIEHYRQHPKCKSLWCIVYDPNILLPNSAGLKADLEGQRVTNGKNLQVRVFIP